LNFWLYYDLVDAQRQLQWLADRLAEAEEAGEIVYILGHMPPGYVILYLKMHNVITPNRVHNESGWVYLRDVRRHFLIS
jgi:hypothetical protein